VGGVHRGPDVHPPGHPDGLEKPPNFVGFMLGYCGPHPCTGRPGARVLRGDGWPGLNLPPGQVPKSPLGLVG